jgi:hypothetical protein
MPGQFSENFGEIKYHWDNISSQTPVFDRQYYSANSLILILKLFLSEGQVGEGWGIS